MKRPKHIPAKQFEPCDDKCAPKGLQKTWWCGLRGDYTPPDHEEHDHCYKGEWFHCYG